MLRIKFSFHSFLYPIQRAVHGVFALEFILWTIQIVAYFLEAVGLFLISFEVLLEQRRKFLQADPLAFFTLAGLLDE